MSAKAYPSVELAKARDERSPGLANELGLRVLCGVEDLISLNEMLCEPMNSCVEVEIGLPGGPDIQIEVRLGRKVSK